VSPISPITNFLNIVDIIIFVIIIVVTLINIANSLCAIFYNNIHMAKRNYSVIVRNMAICSFFVSPFLGYLYVQSKMVGMEKGIHDDLNRISRKGKTLADVPRKN
jgi:hypothetical protein